MITSSQSETKELHRQLDVFVTKYNHQIMRRHLRNPRVPEKVYRRHAAVTPLELRGAIQILERAMDHMVRMACADKLACTDADYYNPFMILMDAKLACKRALEVL